MATVKRLIDANALDGVLKDFESRYQKARFALSAKAIANARQIVYAMKTVDAVEVVNGRWIPINCECDGICSVCNTKFDNYTNDIFEDWHYCPNCGAKMDGDGNA